MLVSAPTWKSKMSRPVKPTAAICLTNLSISRTDAYCVSGPRADGSDQCSMYDQRRFAMAPSLGEAAGRDNLPASWDEFDGVATRPYDQAVMAKVESADRNGVQVVHRAAAILRALRDETNGLT